MVGGKPVTKAWCAICADGRYWLVGLVSSLLAWSWIVAAVWRVAHGAPWWIATPIALVVPVQCGLWMALGSLYRSRRVLMALEGATNE